MMIDDGNAPRAAAAAGMASPAQIKPQSVAERRAALMVRCAREIAGATVTPEADISVPLSVLEFERELRARYGSSEPELVFRTDSTLERARLDRTHLRHLPKVILRQGAPPRLRAR